MKNTRDRDSIENRLAIARNPNTKIEILMMLAYDFNTEVRVAVASHLATPRDTLRILSQDAHPHVRAAVARHPRTSPAVRNTLSQDPDANVRRVAATRAFKPLRVLEIRPRPPHDTDHSHSH